MQYTLLVRADPSVLSPDTYMYPLFQQIYNKSTNIKGL